MGCPPVCGDNPRALVSGLSYVQVDKHGITILFNLHQCRHAHHELFHAKVCKCGIYGMKHTITCWQIFCPCTHPWPRGCVVNRSNGHFSESSHAAYQNYGNEA